MKKNKKKIRLTKFGKIFFGTLLITVISVICFFNSRVKFYDKEERDNYVVEINYPKIKNKSLINKTNNYINNKKNDFKKQVKNINNTDFKYEFKSSYEVIDNEDLIGVHLIFYEYKGGNHYIRNDKSYYYNENEHKMVSIKDFLIDKESLKRLANLSYYYVMNYSDKNNLNFNEDLVKEGLSYDFKNFEHFNFTDDGLEFIFPPLQVAYYSIGEVKIVIPYAELNGIIKEDYLKYSKTEVIKNNNRNIKEFRNNKLMAFTFDDGPSYIATNKLLVNLDKYDARVTFFVLGSRINNYKDTLKKAYDMGNLIGSHTYSHSNLLKLDDYQVLDEIKKTNYEIKNIINSDTKYLRPPYGSINSKIRTASNMYTILWDLDTQDWKYKDKNKIANYIISNAHDGAIVLLHDLYESSVDGALLAMEELYKRGYRFVTIEEMAQLKNVNLINDKNYFNFINY